MADLGEMTSGKEYVAELALFGGVPLYAEPLHVGRPDPGNRERLIARMNEMLDRRWFTNRGPFVADLEKRLAELLGVKHCISMCNGTVALEIAARALGLEGEVIVPAFTFVATAHALQWQQVTPVFCDIDPRSHNIDPARVEALITPRTTGIVGVHLWGRSCDVDTLTEIARRRKLKLMFDAAHAFGCTRRGRRIGSFGDCEVFSFHATKVFTTFEGGAVTTNDDELATKIRLMQNFGFVDLDKVIYIGTNGKMNEMSAAMGLTQLEGLDQLVRSNKQRYEQYTALLGETPGLTVQRYEDNERCNYHYIIVEVDEKTAGLSRDELIEVLHAERILARRYFHPGVHRMEPYKSYFPHAGLLLPETEGLASRVMSLPNGSSVSSDDIANVASIIKLALANAHEVRARRRGQWRPVASSARMTKAAAVTGAGPDARGASKPPLVSILIPAYKPEFFDEALSSARAQTLQDIEILVGDDCPTEEMAAITKKHAALDPRVIYHRNSPAMGSRQNLVDLFGRARGTYVKILNDDDRLHPACVERMAACLAAFPGVALVTSYRRTIDERGNRLPDRPWTMRPVGEDSVLERHAVVSAVIGGRVNFIGEPTSVMFRRADLGEVRPDIMCLAGRRYVVNGDVVMWLNLLTKGDVLYIVNALSDFRVHAGQEQHSDFFRREAPKAWEDFRVDVVALGLWDRSGPRLVSAKPLGTSRPWWSREAQAICLEVDRAADAGDLEGADRELARALDLMPADPWLVASRGRLALRRGKPEDARRALQQALQADAEMPVAQCSLAVACAQLGLDDEARNAVHHALLLHPADAEARKVNRSLNARRDEPLELRGFLDNPTAGERATGSILVSGWVFANGEADPEIDVWLDGRPLDAQLRREPRLDLLELFPTLTPTNPVPGFRGYLELSHLSPGTHTLSCGVRVGAGRGVLGTRVFEIVSAEIALATG